MGFAFRDNLKMKLISSLSVLACASAKKGPNKNTKCPGVETMSWWTDVHSKVDCASDAINDQCEIECTAPWVTYNPEKPHEPWKAQCKTPANPQWKNPSWSKRPDNSCYYCPAQTVQTKPQGGKIVSKEVNAESGKLEGVEVRVRFDESYFVEPTTCGKFLFGLKSAVPFPADASFSAMGATATFVSVDRTLVTFQPLANMNDMQHTFWHKDHHDGTRVYIAGTDLSNLKSSDYSIKAVVTCLDQGDNLADLSCGATPTTSGIALQEPCDNVVTTTTATTTTQAPTTTTTTKATTQSTNTTTTKTTTTTKRTTTTTEPSGGGNCVYGGSHSMGSTPNWWQAGSGFEYQAYVTVPITSDATGGWYVDITLENPVSAVQFWSGTATKLDSQGYMWRFQGWEDETHSAPNLHFTYIGMQTVPGHNNAQTTFNGFQNVLYCTGDGSTNTGGGGGGGGTGSTAAPTTQGPTTTTTPRETPAPCVGDDCGFWGHEPTLPSNRCNNPQELASQPSPQTTPTFKSGASDYEKLLHLSGLFYEAQRSGPLPPDNRIPWRWHTAMNDGCDVGHDLTGGWYDAGDHVKFNFPMAYSTTVLAWGIISFEQGYIAAGELENALDSIKWVTDYLIKCHTGPNELWAQTAEGGPDHSFWGRPEEYPLNLRPRSFKVDANNPGSDVAAETAAALAASSIAYRRFGATELADEALSHAQEIFDFANSYRGTYTGSVPAGDFYNSWSGYNDELVWGAASDIARAENLYNQFQGASYEPFSWDNKKIGSQVLMYDITGKSSYGSTVSSNVNQMINGQYTPGGMLYVQTWGPARHAMNAAFIAAQAAFQGIGDYSFTESQAQYMVGNNPQNQCFVVGWDQVAGGHSNCPRQPHHRSSSCPASGNCNSGHGGASSSPNPMILYGALVGGPGSNDQYSDTRTDYIANEVATDYNAGWQGALAALIQNA